MLTLSQPLRSQVNIVRQSKETRGDVCIDFIIRTARDLLASMTPSDDTAAMGNTKEVVNKKKEQKPPNGLLSLLRKIIQFQFKAPLHPRSAKPIMKKNSYGFSKFCEYYKSKGHNTLECQAYASKLAAQVLGPANSENGPKPTGHSFPSRPSFCRCGAPNYVPGHVCNTASPAGEPPKNPEHCFRMMRITDTPHLPVEKVQHLLLSLFLLRVPSFAISDFTNLQVGDFCLFCLTFL